jgi:peptide-methionine (R)-S-oxide reductase
MNRRFFLQSALTISAAAVVSQVSPVKALTQNDSNARRSITNPPLKKVIKTDAEWKRILTAEQYYVTRQKGTEAPYSSPLLEVHENGVFECVSCSLPLFSSRTKFESNTGWPSFWSPIKRANVREEIDNSMAESRTEVLCSRCDAHLGHVFDDGPQPTGLRYCMNGVAMKFIKKRGK